MSLADLTNFFSRDNQSALKKAAANVGAEARYHAQSIESGQAEIKAAIEAQEIKFEIKELSFVIGTAAAQNVSIAKLIRQGNYLHIESIRYRWNTGGGVFVPCLMLNSSDPTNGNIVDVPLGGQAIDGGSLMAAENHVSLYVSGGSNLYLVNAAASAQPASCYITAREYHLPALFDAVG